MPEVSENGVEDHEEMEKLARMSSKDFNDSWSDTQHKTFKNWMNSRLKDKCDWQVEDLSVDLQDGCVLCRLLEILTSKSIGRCVEGTAIRVVYQLSPLLT